MQSCVLLFCRQRCATQRRRRRAAAAPQAQAAGQRLTVSRCRSAAANGSSSGVGAGSLLPAPCASAAVVAAAMRASRCGPGMDRPCVAARVSLRQACRRPDISCQIVGTQALGSACKRCSKRGRRLTARTQPTHACLTGSSTRPSAPHPAPAWHRLPFCGFVRALAASGPQRLPRAPAAGRRPQPTRPPRLRR